MGRVVDGYKTFVELANKNDDAKGLMAGWNRVIQFIVEGDDDFYLKIEGGQVSLTIGIHESPNVTLKGPEGVMFKMLSGELDATRAYFAKQYTIEGSMSDAMKFGRVGAALAKAR